MDRSFIQTGGRYRSLIRWYDICWVRKFLIMPDLGGLLFGFVPDDMIFFRGGESERKLLVDEGMSGWDIRLG